VPARLAKYFTTYPYLSGERTGVVLLHAFAR
jgi:hypothetical protein